MAVVSSKNADNIAEQARAAVAEALARRNVALVVAEPDGPKITVTVSERPASLAVVTNEGQVLSGAKRPRLFQDCADRTQRLLLVLETAGSPPVRAWAEEDHCKSDLVANVAVLAERAVAALADRKAGVTTRSGRD